MPTTYHHDQANQTVYEVEEPWVSDGASKTWYIRTTVLWVSATWQPVGGDYQCEGGYQFDDSYNKSRDTKERALEFFKTRKLGRYTAFPTMARAQYEAQAKIYRDAAAAAGKPPSKV